MVLLTLVNPRMLMEPVVGKNALILFTPACEIAVQELSVFKNVLV